MYELARLEASLASLNHFFFNFCYIYSYCCSHEFRILLLISITFWLLLIYAQVRATMYSLSLFPLNVITWLCSCIIFTFAIITGIGMESLCVFPVVFIVNSSRWPCFIFTNALSQKYHSNAYNHSKALPV
jgi:hypothetical protein